MKKKVAIIGAGPAGLTSGLLLAKAGLEVIIYEADPQYVGGLSKTVIHNGFRFDIGGHRFFSKDEEIRSFWQNLLGDDLLINKRSSKIYYKKKLLNYPLDFKDIFVKLGIRDLASFSYSWLISRTVKKTKPTTFESWMISRFGQNLYEAFFRSYTEKVWGRKCSEISSDWADQRIQNLSVTSIIKNIFKQAEVKSLISSFDYPKLGPGMLWEKVAKDFRTQGGRLVMGTKVTSLKKRNDNWLIETENESINVDHVISSMPLGPMLSILEDVPQDILNTAKLFEYRSFITVAIMFKGENPFNEQWIYIQEPTLKVGRIQNYKNWSPYLVPNSDDVCLGLEYFCQEGDDFWKLTDSELLELAKSELKILNIAGNEDIVDFMVIRQKYAYPVYDLQYKERLQKIKTFLKTQKNLYCVGRSGLHRYNNQDHSIKTAMLVCENILTNKDLYDPWLVNQDAIYQEEN